MNYKTFEQCFEALCLSFDIDFEKKKNRMEHYFDSKLGELAEHVFLEVIKTAKQSLDVKPGFLPSVKTLEDIFYSRPRSHSYTEESFATSPCGICDGTGRVSLWENGYLFGGFCCTCTLGREKLVKTELGREMGLYVDALKRGFTQRDESLPRKPPF